nr:hypothetical protein [Bacteroidota bacterium]
MEAVAVGMPVNNPTEYLGVEPLVFSTSTEWAVIVPARALWSNAFVFVPLQNIEYNAWQQEYKFSYINCPLHQVYHLLNVTSL